MMTEVYLIKITRNTVHRFEWFCEQNNTRESQEFAGICDFHSTLWNLQSTEALHSREDRCFVQFRSFSGGSQLCKILDALSMSQNKPEPVIWCLTFFFFPRWGSDERVIGTAISYLKIQLRGSTLSRITLVKVREVLIVSAPFNLTWLNSCCYSDQRFWHVNEACGSFSLVLTHKDTLHAAFNKRSFTCRLNCNNNYYLCSPCF